MELKNNFFYTIREDIKDEESVSGKLLVKSGLIKKSSNGIYVFMPLGLRVIEKIKQIIREEMNKEGALELLMPSLLPSEVYEKSGRKANFGKDMFALKDRYERDYVLGPTHEELFVNAASNMIKSYKDMPFNLYQIANKYRDEPRPRYGLIRVREFIMKDAYSFDKNYEGLDISYSKMYRAYKNIFDRVGLSYCVVTADTGVMGGLLSEEFQAITDIGEDILVLCDNCDYASNIEVGVSRSLEITKEDSRVLEKIYTPNVKTIEEVSAYLQEKTNKFVKTLIYKIDNSLYGCLIPGDRELNETKVRKLLNAKTIELASREEVNSITKVGFAGPIGIGVPLIIDNNILKMFNFVIGANEKDYHYKNANITDFKYDFSGDIIKVKESDLCPKCGSKLYFKKGIEVGNIFKLGDKYSKALDLTYLDQNNESQYVIMGSYGIGLGRILASIVEQNNDENGIVFPLNVAPFKVAIVEIDSKNEEISSKAKEIYELLEGNGIDTLLDNRNIRPGIKFNDMDLIGIPIKITVGNKVKDNKVEIKLRASSDIKEVEISNVLDEIEKLIKAK